MIARAVVLAALIAALAGSSATAQLLPSQSGATEAPAAASSGSTTRKPRTAPDFSCVDVVVKASAKRPDGKDWDPYRNKELPDYRIHELTTGTKAACENTSICTIRIHPVTSTLEFDIVDHDWPDKDDPIGSGTCPVGGTCTLGLAQLKMTSC